MPRGGGGGFRGGGGGGGGFRGGGFRGGSRSFRVGSVRSSGRPFGRTGARRTVSRSPSQHGAGRSTFWRRPHRRYWGPYYRPWYRRWWYWNWWWGYPGRPWYYAPVYWGGGVALAIIIALLIIPIIGLAIIPYPFTNASSDGLVNYRDTQTLYYNEYWYERETMSAGGSITYSMDAISPSGQGVTFIIANHPFEAFPATSQRSGTYSENDMVVKADHDYQYIGYFLKPGSSLDYYFEVVSGTIEFFIADANDLNRWNNWESIVPEDEYIGSGNYSNQFIIPYAQDWYLVWYNPNQTPAVVDFVVDYIAEDVYDFSSAPVNIGPTESVPESTFAVPTSGTWYFFVYFDPFVNPDYSVDITFDVSYETGVTHTDRWSDLRPILLIIGAIIVIILIIALIQRRSKKSQPQDITTVTTPITPSTTTPAEVVTTSSSGQCQRCRYDYKVGDVYCKNCGAKLIGRDYGSSSVTTPASSSNCKSCGQAIIPGSKYCKHCGAKVITEKGYSYFPDERKSFYCQLDGSKHPSTDSAYQCTQCSRMICKNCYDDLGRTEVSVCPYCKGSLHQIQ